MSKITLNSIADLTQSSTAQTTINTNSSTIQTAFDNTLSRDGTSPNQMGAALDMNSNQILNLPSPGSQNSPLRLQDLTNFLGGTGIVGPTGLTGPTGPAGSNGTNGAFTNTRLAKTANYTVLSADTGSTIALSGGFFTLTYSAANGYSATFLTLVVNEDTSRGKTIALSGLASFILWPGQSIIVYNDNNVWKVFGRSRWALTGTTTLFVDVVNGNDNNDGLAASTGNAVKTITQAVITIAANQLDLAGNNLIVQLADGTYTSGLHFPGPLMGAFGNASLVIQGNAGTPSNVIVTDTDNVNGGIAIAMFQGARCELKNMKLQGGALGSDGGLFVETGAVCRLEGGIIFGLCAAGAHMHFTNGGTIIADSGYSISGNALYHVQSFQGGLFSVQSQTINFTANVAFTAFVLAQEMSSCNFGNATINLNANTVTGKRYQADNLSLIDTFSGGANFLPGNSAGSVSNGGVYA